MRVLIILLLAMVPLCAGYGDLPLHFEPNRGQATSQTRFIARTGAYSLAILDDGAVMTLESGRRLQMRLGGARRPRSLDAENKLPGISSYFIGPDPKQWRRNIPQFARVKLRGVYPGIDLAFHGNQRRIEYDFVLAPHADPSRIRFHMDGADALRIGEQGQLMVEAGGTEFCHLAPVAWQGTDAGRKTVDVRFLLEGRNVSFVVGEYDRSKELLIDPTIDYSTYLGGSLNDNGYGIAVDGNGAAYVAGTTNSPDFPNSYTGIAGLAYVVKINPQGTAIDYSVVFGQSGTAAFSVAVDSMGSAYFAGTTNGNIAIRNAFQAQYRGNGDLYVVKLNPAGDDLVYSTYIGGSGVDSAPRALRIDSMGDVYLAAITTSTDFPTRTPFQATLAGQNDAVVLKLNPAGSDLIYSTYLGGSGSEGEYCSIALDGDQVVVTGITGSPNFPLQNQIQSSMRGVVDIFLTKLNSTGTGLIFSTYLGSSADDINGGVGVDSTGMVWLAGFFGAADFPGRNAEAFLAKINTATSDITFPATLGMDSVRPKALAIGPADSVFVTGNAGAALPLVRPFWSVPPNASDTGGFITRVDNAGSIGYSSFLGTRDAFIEAIAVDGTGAAYLTGRVGGVLPTRNPLQPSSHGNQEAFVTKISEAEDATLVSVTIGAAPTGTGLIVTVDGQTVVSQRQFLWLQGTTHTISTVATQGGGGNPLRFVFESWSDGGELMHDIVVPAAETTITANFQPQIRLTTDVLPAGGGTVAVTPAAADGYYPLNSTVTLTATANPGFFFNSWSGIITGETNPQPVQLTYSAAQPLSSATASFSGTPPNLNRSLGFVPVTPCRLVDTRPSEGKTGAFGAPILAADSTRDIPVPQSDCNIPSTARAYAVNVTVVPSGPLAFLTLFPTGANRPVVSTLNAFEGQVVANAAIVPAGNGGAISAYVTDQTHLVIDINGYFTESVGPEALSFYSITPCRVADTRAGFGPPALGPATTTNFGITQSGCGIPATAKAFSLNFTAVPVGPLAYISAWPAGQPQPLVSTLNSFLGRVLANAAIVPAGNNGAISVYASNPTDLIIDINGYFAPPNGSGNAFRFYAMSPCRIADTRQGEGFNAPFGPPSLAGLETRNFPLFLSSCGLPLTTRAFSLNATVVPPGYFGYLTFFPSLQPRPLVSTLNALEGQVAANAAIVAGTSGNISAFAANPTELILDINGYFAP